MKAQYSIWLLPDAAHELRLTKTIADLSKSQGESAFAPHVTIQGDLRQPGEKLAELVVRLAEGGNARRWRIQGVECSDHFFRCLYLRFVPDASFATLQDSTHAITGTTDGLSPFPHLSLAYGHATGATRQLRDELAERFAGGDIVFDRIALVRSSKDIPIAEWQILEQRPLASRFAGK